MPVTRPLIRTRGSPKGRNPIAGGNAPGIRHAHHRSRRDRTPTPRSWSPLVLTVPSLGRRARTPEVIESPPIEPRWIGEHRGGQQRQVITNRRLPKPAARSNTLGLRRRVHQQTQREIVREGERGTSPSSLIPRATVLTPETMQQLCDPADKCCPLLRCVEQSRPHLPALVEPLPTAVPHPVRFVAQLHTDMFTGARRATHERSRLIDEVDVRRAFLTRPTACGTRELADRITHVARLPLVPPLPVHEGEGRPAVLPKPVLNLDRHAGKVPASHHPIRSPDPGAPAAC